MAKMISTLAIFVSTILVGLHQTTAAAQELHVVGDNLVVAPPPINLVPAPARAPVTFVVGDVLGWAVPPEGPPFYPGWAVRYIMYVGDTLVFNFPNGTEDVAVVAEAAYGPCNTNNPTLLLTTSPAKITLATAGPYFFTSTYPGHCSLGQKFAIYVRAGTSSFATPPGSVAEPAPVNAYSPTAGGPVPSPSGSPPTTALTRLFCAAFLSIVTSFLL